MGVRALTGVAAAFAAPMLTAAVAAADPAPAPPPPPPPAEQALLNPAGLLGPVDGMVPVALLDPKTYRMPDPGQQPSPYVLTQGAPPGPFAFVEALKGTHAMVHGALGRMPGEDLGTALPGTAPPPGTALPPGLEEFLVVPGDAPPAPPP